MAADKVRGVVAAPDRVWEAALEQARVWETEEVERAGWVAERWDLKETASAPSAEHGLHTKEAFPVWNRNVPIAEQP
jgi:hypothetical protein